MRDLLQVGTGGLAGAMAPFIVSRGLTNWLYVPGHIATLIINTFGTGEPSLG